MGTFNVQHEGRKYNKELSIPYYSFPKLKKLKSTDNVLEFMDYDYMDFASKEEMVKFFNECFYEVGSFNYNEHNLKVKFASDVFSDKGYYCEFVEDSFDFVKFWEGEKEKCVKGVIIHNGERYYYYPGDLYFWFNYLPIYNKARQKVTLPEHSDLQHYISLYENIAFLENKHAAIVKKRQSGSSYYHAAKLIRVIWFLESKNVKLLAYNEGYLRSTWEILEEYADFLNSNTAWIRPMNPDKVFHWKQQIEIREDGVKMNKGLKSVIIARTMNESPTKGVGGPSWLVFYEEAGIAPTLNETFMYMAPALKEGDILTGQFIAAGSVGEMEDSKPLRDMVLNPDNYNIKKVKNRFVDSTGVVKETALFIPECYRYLPYVDKFGNSLVDEAINHIKEKRELEKQRKSYEEFQIMITQEPLTLEEAFAYKKESKFPVVLIKKEIDKLTMLGKTYKCYDLEYDSNGKIIATESNKLPIDKFPLPPNTPNKEGVLQVWEEPDPSLGFGSYIIGVDPVAEGKTTTSNSLASVYVLRQPVERTIYNEDGTLKENIILPPKVVACWSGRYDDLEKTNEQILKIIEWYKGVAVVENNINNFIHYCIRQRKQHYLIKRNQLMFLKDLNSNVNVHQEYGFRNTGDIMNNMIDYTITFLKTEIGEEKIPGTDEIRIVKGVEYINDKLVLEEMLQYGIENTDRLISLTAAISYYYVVNSYKSFVKSVVQEKKDTNNAFSFKEKDRNKSSFKRIIFNKLR